MTDLKMTDYMDDFKKCLQYEKPYCQAECPFHIDINDFIEKIKQGNFNSAFIQYRNAVGFPVIVSHICSQPCQGVCPMKDHGGAIELRELEKAAVEYARRKDPTSYNIPAKSGKIAIIGSGPAGLGALLRMATKKYETHIFEKADRLGGSLNAEPEVDLFIEDVNRQLQFEKYEAHLNCEIQTRDEIDQMEFDAVFVATGKNGSDFDIDMDGVRLAGKTAWFTGGALTGDEGIYALAGGLYMGIVLESYLKTGKLDHDINTIETNVLIDSDRIKDMDPVIPTGPVYSTEESISESNRCLKCQCDFCRTYEDLTVFYDKWPLRIKDEIFATTLEGSSEVKATPAKRLLSTSNLTGIVKEVCPMDIDLDDLILAGRQKMHRLDKAPWAFHDFWLRDMEFSNGENAALTMSNSSSAKTTHVFFPGCQLGASMPELVTGTFELLQAKDDSMGLILKCCGAPALWSGYEDKHDEVLKEIRSQWQDMGKPIFITACPTCTSQLKKYLPEIDTVSVYGYLDQMNHIRTEASAEMKGYSVFDPCSTSEDPGIKTAVRNLIDKLGADFHELPLQSGIQRCCSYGGQPAIANPDYIEYVVDKRISESELPYITYCINCRDTFLKAGKRTHHILELILGTENATVPTASQRRNNRVHLKKTLMKKYDGNDMDDTRKKYDFRLIIPDEILKEMDNERILEEEVYNVVEFIIRTNQKVIDPGTGIHSGHRQIGYMTYWVSYKETDDDGVFEITDVYNHRMEIELEAVWNGTKSDLEV